jgi:acyl carrier protein
MSVEDSVRDFILKEVAVGVAAGELSNDAPLIERGVIDSLGIFQLVSYLEEEYGIDVTDDELVLANFGTLSAIGEYVRAKRAEP